MLRWASVIMVSGSAAAMAPQVDRSASTPVATITREDLARLPVGRRVENLIRTCPARTIRTVVRPMVDGVSTGPGLLVEALRYRG